MRHGIISARQSVHSGDRTHSQSAFDFEHRNGTADTVQPEPTVKFGRIPVTLKKPDRQHNGRIPFAHSANNSIFTFAAIKIIIAFTQGFQGATVNSDGL